MAPGSTSLSASETSAVPGPAAEGAASDELVSAASAATPQAAAVLQVVDEYIREQTAEGAPYYIDSSATAFVGFEKDVRPEDEGATCTARFASDRDTYFVRFVLSREMGRYVIHRVVLDRLNDRPVGRTLFNRDALVL